MQKNNKLNTLPAFYSVFLYGRWAEDSNDNSKFLSILQKCSVVSNPVEFKVLDISIPDTGSLDGDDTPKDNTSDSDTPKDDTPNENQLKGFLITASDEEADCEYMNLSDIMYIVEQIRQHAPGNYMKNTQIENFHWANNSAYVDLSCL